MAVDNGKTVWETKELSEKVSVVGRFWATKSYQFSPFFTKNVHRRGSKADLRAPKRGFSGSILLERVEPLGLTRSNKIDPENPRLGALKSAFEPLRCTFLVKNGENWYDFVAQKRPTTDTFSDNSFVSPTAFPLSTAIKGN